MFLSDDQEQPSMIANQIFNQEISAEFNKEDLVNALHAVSAAQTDTEIGWIQINFTGDKKIIFSSTNHNLSIKYEFNSYHLGSGIIKVSGRQISEYVKQLPPATIYLNAQLPYNLNLKCAGSSAKIQLVQDQSLNHIIPSYAGTSITVKGTYLERWINSFKDLVLVDDSRFYANGALVWVDTKNNNNHLYSVASDALRLSQSCLTEGLSVNCCDEGQVIVPKKAWEELKRECAMSPNNNFVLNWSKNDLSFSAESEGYLLFSKCITGNYPPYEAAFPEKINFEIEFDLKAMQDSVKRSMIFADKNKTLKFIFENSLLKMSTHTLGQKEGQEVLEMQTEVDTPFDVNYNGHHLAGILNVVSGSRVHFYWESVTKPVKIVGEEQKGLTVFYLLVPSRF